MKILVIHGSPHNGHTMKLTKKFEEAVKRCSDADFEYISVSKLNIDMCKGCFVCVTRGEELCPLKSDDAQLVVKKMNEADGVVFSAKIGFLKMAASKILAIPIGRSMQKEKSRVNIQQKFLDW